MHHSNFYLRWCFILNWGVRTAMFLFFLLSSPLILHARHIWVCFVTQDEWVLFASTLLSDLLITDDTEMAVTIVECFYIKVDPIQPLLLQLYPLGLSSPWYHHRLQNLFPLVSQMNHLALHWKIVAYLCTSLTTYHYHHLPTKPISIARRGLCYGEALHWWEWNVGYSPLSLFLSFSQTHCSFCTSGDTWLESHLLI